MWSCTIVVYYIKIISTIVVYYIKIISTIVVYCSCLEQQWKPPSSLLNYIIIIISKSSLKLENKEIFSLISFTD